MSLRIYPGYILIYFLGIKAGFKTGKYYEIPYDKNIDALFLKDFKEYFKNKNFEEKYLKLLANLDNDSKTLLSRIMKNIFIPLNGGDRFYDKIHTQEEKTGLMNLQREFYDKIVKISDNIYQYKQYLLPKYGFEPQTFYEKYENLFPVEKIKNKAILDVGGYIGDSALIFQEYTNDKVYAFEPVKENFDCLLQTIKLNNADKIVPVNIGLGDKEEVMSISLKGCSSTLEKANNAVDMSNNTEQVSLTTLDKYMETNRLDVGLIKVDIEGFEMSFLKGAEKTIKEQAPVLYLSIYHNASDFFEIKPYIESLGVYNSFKLYKPLSRSVRIDLALIAQKI
ncbi:MAG: FkbM family methyltransferase [Heliobacteriaceae bacterium]|nr:FkbM family methyltransferase [Heliobacteriaceae bacterium]